MEAHPFDSQHATQKKSYKFLQYGYSLFRACFTKKKLPGMLKTILVEI